MTLNELEATVNEQIAEIRHFVRKKNRTWLIVAGVAVVLLAVLFWTVFSKKDKADPRIEDLQNQIEHLQQSNRMLDSLIKEQDTLLIENRVKETRIIERHDKIPADIKSLDREQLRREVTNF